MHGFWPRAFCARLSAAISQMPQRVKNSSIFKNFSWFSPNKAQPQPLKFNSSASRYSWLGFYSIPAIPAGFYSKKDEIKESKPAPFSKCQSKDCNLQRDLMTTSTSSTEHEKAVALACSVLSELKIKINTSNPIKQIKGLSTDQEMRAFNYLQNLFVDEDDESDLATLYSIMQHLKAPRVQYPEFFDIIANNLSDCRRDALTKALPLCKNVPQGFKEEFGKFMTPTFAWEYTKACFRGDGPPKELHNVLRKVPCSTSTWQAPVREKIKATALQNIHMYNRHVEAEKLLNYARMHSEF
jgi:hypothetical protein